MSGILYNLLVLVSVSSGIGDGMKLHSSMGITICIQLGISIWVSVKHYKTRYGDENCGYTYSLYPLLKLSETDLVSQYTLIGKLWSSPSQPASHLEIICAAGPGN